MRLERLDIRGYRRLRGSYELAPGLTLVTGPNESGKSTLHDALVRSLFGFSPPERRRHGGDSQRDERAPWGGGPFGVTLHARDREGHVVLVIWDFARDLVELQDALTGESLQREKPKQSGDYELGQRLVGMTREEFLQVCCLHQNALGGVRPSDELRASLQRAVESAPAPEKIGVQGADERLRGLLSGIGVHGGHYRELPSGELQRLIARESELEQALAAARAQREELDHIAASLDRSRERTAELARERQRAQESSAGPPLAATPGSDPTGPEADPARLEGGITGPEGDPAGPESDPEGDPVRLGGDPTVARFREQRDELLSQLALPEAQPRWNSALLAGALALAALAALGAALVHPALAMLLVGAAGCVWAARPRPSGEERPDPLASFGGRSFAELDQMRVEEDDRLRALQAKRLAERLGAQRELDIEIAELRAVLQERETNLAEREANLADPADLEVQLAETRARRERLELTRDAIRIARDALGEAARDTHRRVAPHLNEALRRALPRITRGRYCEAAVDEDLAIRLHAPESGGFVSVEQLSRGTRDQVALVQRLEIARLLDPTAGRAPLLLDDPFAHFDPERLRLGAELLAEVAGHRQAIVFTESPEVASRIREACPGCALIELPDPVGERQVRQPSAAPPANAAGTLAGM
ncbi:MAG TPA: AAA family ATPase [Solirubrobacteraceae bacterium]|nr:AAA family ATPase [Solirubrobacteraceae bacterium]